MTALKSAASVKACASEEIDRLYGVIDAELASRSPWLCGKAISAAVAAETGLAVIACCDAMVATAIGLFAAIPAVVAYNGFAHDIDRLSTRFDTFIEEFSNILQRQGGGGQAV